MGGHFRGCPAWATIESARLAHILAKQGRGSEKCKSKATYRTIDVERGWTRSQALQKCGRVGNHRVNCHRRSAEGLWIDQTTVGRYGAI